MLSGSILGPLNVTLENTGLGLSNLQESWNLPRDDSEMLDSQGTFQGHKSLVLMQHEENDEMTKW